MKLNRREEKQMEDNKFKEVVLEALGVLLEKDSTEEDKKEVSSKIYDLRFPK